MVNVDSLCANFRVVFDRAAPTVWSRAPGRVCLLGEHTDYNDGFVLPVAIAPAVHIAAGPRADDRLLVHSAAMGETAAVELADLAARRTEPRPFTPAWSNYVFGVAVLLARKGIALRGGNLLIESDVPVGGGVSSSAALEVATAKALLALSDATLDDLDIAMLARQAEHEFAGSPCGILDQFACVFSRDGCALRLDCRTKAYERIAFGFDTCMIAVLDSRTRHDLATSEYPLRQAQCRAGVAALAPHRPGLTALRDVSLDLLDAHAAELDPVVHRRCRHVVTENDRVGAGVEALRAGDAPQFGRLMSASHASLRCDYEVSCPELDALVEIATTTDGVWGAKMSGGGFGGCVVALLEAESADSLRAAIRQRYDSRFPQPATVLLTRPAAGAEVHTL